MDSRGGIMSTKYEGKWLFPAPELGSGGGSHNQRYVFHVQAPRTVVLFGAVALSCFLLGYYSSPLQVLTHDYNSFSSAAVAGGEGNKFATPVVEKATHLGTILNNAAMDDKTVIITTLNKAWAEPNSVFDLFLESFQIGNQTQRLLKHLVVIALDQHAYARCSQIHPHCYAFDTNGTDFSGEAFYMKPDYLDMMWRRLNFLGSVLDLGYNFLFTDTDIMWFRDPFPHFHVNADFQIACDHFGGNASDINNLPNAGFTFVRSNNKSIDFYKYWYAAREKFPGVNEQDVLNLIKFDPFISEIGLQIKFLDTAYFGGFCEISKDLNKVCTMHANCCVGLDNKVFDIGIMLDDWRKYMASQKNQTVPQYYSWTVPKHCGNASIILQQG